MEIKKAKDIMIRLDQYPYVSYDSTILDAMKKLSEVGLRVDERPSLPRFVLVFNEKKELVGMARRRDFLRGLEPESLAGMMPTKRRKIFEAWGADGAVPHEKILGEMRSRMDRPVSDVMLPIKVTVDYEDHIFEVIYKMTENNLSMVPVLKDGMVEGVVRTVELVNEVCRILHVPGGNSKK